MFLKKKNLDNKITRCLLLLLIMILAFTRGYAKIKILIAIIKG